MDQPSQSRLILSTNDKTIKLWKVSGCPVGMLLLILLYLERFNGMGSCMHPTLLRIGV